MGQTDAIAGEGALITLEGTDGSGKSTQTERLSRWLSDHGVDHLATFEPGGTRLGERIRQCFLEVPTAESDGKLEALLMFADRRLHLTQLIGPALERGKLVLCDRFTDSTLAYQGFGRGVDLEQLRRLDQWATGGVRPALTLLFDVPPATAASRARSDAARDNNRLDRERAEFYRRVRAGYLQLAAEEPARIRVIDASGPLEVTCDEAIAALSAWLVETGRLPLPEEVTSARQRRG